MKNSEFREKLRILLYLPWSIRFNFHYFPFKQARKLPVIFYVRPTFLALKGKVVLGMEDMPFNTVRFGKEKAPMLPRKSFRWSNQGTVYFNGKLDCSHHTFISCDPNAVLKFGDTNRINFGCRFIANKEIVFGDKVRISWDCTFIDSDYHPIIDMVSCRRA